MNFEQDPGRWYVVRTELRAEAGAAEGLVALALPCPFEGVVVRCFTPMEKQVRRMRGGRTSRRDVIERPVFPRYVFARLPSSCDDVVGLVLAVDGVTGVMGSKAGKPLPVPLADIKRLMLAEAAGDYDRTPRKIQLERDMPLMVRRGPFTGFKVRFLAERADDRVQVLMQVLGGGEWPVELHRADVQPIAA